MKFEPKPSNPFPRFIETYFNRCRAVCPKLRAIAGKWTFEDLIPGLSDFDSRVIFSDDVTVSDWAQMSLAVGKVHTQLAQEFPAWARILEHLPGLNLMHREVINPMFYYPEFQQWSYYHGDKGVIGSITGELAKRPWSKRDEIFHLKKFAIYFGPYMRGIDPAVNIGAFENKYPLHSRFMHYFTPPVQSAVSILRKQAVAGKFQALHLAREMFPNPYVIDMIFDAVDKHYEIPEYYDEPKLSAIEAELDAYLRDVYRIMKDHVTLIGVNPDDTPAELKNKVKAIPIDPMEQFYEGVKFSRFMKGRLRFYATPITWFDTAWLIRNELGRILQNFHDQPLRIFEQIRYKQGLTTEQVLDRIRDEKILTPEQHRDILEFVRICKLPLKDGEEKQRATEVANVFESVQVMVEGLGEILLS